MLAERANIMLPKLEDNIDSQKEELDNVKDIFQKRGLKNITKIHPNILLFYIKYPLFLYLHIQEQKLHFLYKNFFFRKCELLSYSFYFHLLYIK